MLIPQSRNVKRHEVVTDREILSLRVDESLYFPNARFIEDYINAAVADNPAIRHVILECPAVHLTHHDAVASISPELTVRTLRAEGVRRAM